MACREFYYEGSAIDDKYLRVTDLDAGLRLINTKI